MNPAGFARRTQSNLDLQPTAQVQLLLAVLSRWWLLAVFLLLGGGATYLYLSRQPVTYQASATVLVGTNAPGQGNAGLITANQDVIQTYAVLMTQRSVLIAVNDRLRLGLSRPEALNSEIRVEQPPGTSLLIVTVLDANPRHAVDIANAVPSEFIKIESNIGSIGSADEHAVLIQQINALQTDVDRRSEPANLRFRQPHPTACQPVREQRSPEDRAHSGRSGIHRGEELMAMA
jgi:capsular polysaccharide biosynthesis protein